MKVDVYAYYGDTCGNGTEHYYATYECESLEQAEKIFAHGFLCGWRVYEHTRIIRKLPTKPPQFPTEQDMERGQFKPAEFERQEYDILVFLLGTEPQRWSLYF